MKVHDAARMTVQSTVDDEYTIEPSIRKTKNCCIRLLNILFSDGFASRLASSDASASREQIDTGEVNHNTQFCKEVADEFRNNTPDYNGLFTDDNPLFDGIDPSNIVPHETSRLYEMWKQVNSKYVKAYSRFYVSGQNSNEFFNFCDGILDVVYLKTCIKIKPELEEYIRGGMRKEDEIDSLDLKNDVTARRPRLQKIVVADRSAAASQALDISAEDGYIQIDRIGKLHRLINQVKERQRRAELERGADGGLATSLVLYQKRLG
ncbi:hypothetical protein PHMEG_00033924 [Phytophthora megakarya]|uniref:Uncharacterized protein n=1 Tax=Phytophthora megakarya TaxID=4795 RepID=A0A225US00_9STRA|nr:hypothetical protein PHMEG_00033924 [Phytophthora megakarya]